MEIDRSNYEIWLIDWLDGNLSDLQVEQLQVFLNENPDLKEDLNELKIVTLKSPEKSFPDKDRLKKSTADLTYAQFEYLSVAYLEKDISSGQQAELMETIEQDPEKKRSFELIQKTKLVPASLRYKDKSKLKKRTLIRNVMRFPVIGLSAAATIALLIAVYLLIPDNLYDKSKDGMLSVSEQHKDGVLSVSAQNIMADNDPLQPSVNKLTVKKDTEFKIFIPEKIYKNLIPVVHKKNSVISQSKLTEAIPKDSLRTNPGNPKIEHQRIPVHLTIDLNGGLINNTLIASGIPVTIPVYEDERSKLGRFIAKTFREKILKESASKDGPLKGYELAEAGVTGLNKLFGWEMALDEKNDENGELKSIYFSSKLLKFNAPVKKSEPLQ